jgi:hypothetical protein
MPGSHVHEIREFRLERRNGRRVEICLYVNTAGAACTICEAGEPRRCLPNPRDRREGARSRRSPGRVTAGGRLEREETRCRSS